MKAVTDSLGNFSTGPASIIVPEPAAFSLFLPGKRYAVTTLMNSMKAITPKKIQSFVKKERRDVFVEFGGFFPFSVITPFHGHINFISAPLNHIPVMVNMRNATKNRTKSAWMDSLVVAAYFRFMIT